MAIELRPNTEYRLASTDASVMRVMSSEDHLNGLISRGRTEITGSLFVTGDVTVGGTVIGTVDGSALQLDSDGIGAGGNPTGGVDQLRLTSLTNSQGAGIGFTDHLTPATAFDSRQRGYLRFFHADANNRTGTGAVFKFGSSETLAVDLGSADLWATEVTASTITAASELRSKGDVIAYYSSDKRMKDNIINISNPLDKIQQIRGVYFDWNAKGPDWTRTHYYGSSTGSLHDVGLIAQEVQSILPEAVRTRDSGYLAVDYKRLVPLLVEGIKDQQKQIESLEGRLSKLENR